MKPHKKLKISNLFYRSILLILSTIFVNELVSMYIIKHISFSNLVTKTLVDAITFSILLFPSLYFWVFMPFAKQVKKDTFQQKEFLNSKTVSLFTNEKISNNDISFINSTYSTNKIVTYLVLSLFIGEIFSMLIVYFINFSNHFEEMIADSMVLIVFSLPALYFFVYHPLTLEIKKREKALLDLNLSELKFRSAFLTSPDAICINRLNTGEFISINKGFTTILGYTENDVMGNHPKDLNIWKKPKEKEKMYFILNKYGFVNNFEMEIESKSGVLIYGLLSATILEIEGVQHIMCITKDITEIKNNEIILQEAKQKAEESDQLKTEFLHNMSHEIRTPLNGILGFSNFLNEPDLSPEKRVHFINIIQNSGKQLMQIIDDILEISILETKQVKVIENQVCLNDILLELFSIFDIKAKENKTPLFLKRGLTDLESTLFTDKTKVNKILSNLLENALKFTTEGNIELGYQLKNKELEIYVKDTGIGINPKKHALIFDRFSQAEKDLSKNVGGLGLGLSIAKENTELLGGKISVSSKLGKGATFLVTIPYKPVYSNSETTTINSTDLDKSTILIVEDEEINFLYLETLLVENLKINCEIVHAKNGKESIAICKINPKIDIVLMDLKMPIMNGFEATKQLKKLYPNLPIIAQTAYSSKEDQAKAFTAGCNDFISKPITKEMLHTTIKKYIEI